MAVAEPAQPVSPALGIAPDAARFDAADGPWAGRADGDTPHQRSASTHRQVSSNGRVIEPAATSKDRNWGTMLHLSPLLCVLVSGTGVGIVAIVLPLILWLIRHEESAYHDDHGREVLNFCLSFVIWHILLIVTLIGAVFIPVLWIVALISLIRGAVAAGQGEYFRYPITFRLLR